VRLVLVLFLRPIFLDLPATTSSQPYSRWDPCQLSPPRYHVNNLPIHSPLWLIEIQAPEGSEMFLPFSSCVVNLKWCVRQAKLSQQGMRCYVVSPFSSADCVYCWRTLPIRQTSPSATKQAVEILRVLHLRFLDFLSWNLRFFIVNCSFLTS
jgi:hypothetical protein